MSSQISLNSLPSDKSSHLGESSGSVGLVGLDDLSASKLVVGVGGPDNLAGVAVDNGQSGEAIARAELAAPAGGDGVVAAGGRATVCLGGVVGLHDIGARSSGGSADLDAESPGALGVTGVAGALHVLDGPLGTVRHHGLAGSRGSHDGRGGEEGGRKDNLSDLHDCDVGDNWALR